MSDWRARANCSGMDPDVFFPTHNGDPRAVEALAACDGCEVRVACLNWAMDSGQEDGIYGGVQSEERRREMRRRRANSLTSMQRAVMMLERLGEGTLDQVARSVGCSRWTVRDAFRPLVAEGRVSMSRMDALSPGVYRWVADREEAS